MSCSAFMHKLSLLSRDDGRQLRQQALASGATASTREYHVHGTWDYKWPLRSKIRVAFQELPGDARLTDDVRDIVRKAADRWWDEASVKYPGLKQLLPKLEWLDPLFEAPLGDANSITDQHRSPFLDASVQYDVLISLQDLPVRRIDPFRDPGSELDVVSFPISDLGSSARRTDYGSPTMYIGRFGHRAVHKQPLAQYLESALGQHVILHEFGHVYGLPHVFQHPDLVPIERPAQVPPQERRRFYRSKSEIIGLTDQLLGIQLSPDQVDGHVLAIWPGSKEFSDWLDIAPAREEHERTGTLDSVMTMPHYKYLLEGVGNIQTRREPGALRYISGNADLVLQDSEIVTSLRPYDLDTLSLMYDPRSDQTPLLR